jgi:hypothetical protein
VVGYRDDPGVEGALVYRQSLTVAAALRPDLGVTVDLDVVNISASLYLRLELVRSCPTSLSAKDTGSSRRLFARVVDCEDVGMAQSGGQVRFADEPFSKKEVALASRCTDISGKSSIAAWPQCPNSVPRRVIASQVSRHS